MYVSCIPPRYYHVGPADCFGVIPTLSYLGCTFKVNCARDIVGPDRHAPAAEKNIAKRHRLSTEYRRGVEAARLILLQQRSTTLWQSCATQLRQNPKRQTHHHSTVRFI